MSDPAGTRQFGVERGKVFPAAKARSLLNPLRRLIQSPRRTVGRLGLAPTARVLEIGPGPGYFSTELVRAAADGEVVLLDVQHEMLGLARTRLAAAGNSRFVQADGARLPFDGSTFDAALIVAVLGEIPDPGGCLDELRRVIRPGGHVLFAETRRDSDFIALAELRPLVEPRGFTLVDRKGVSWEYTARFRREG
jgi:ubiquinone/menaquinone biosynthesis C-methylase UbiE